MDDDLFYQAFRRSPVMAILRADSEPELLANCAAAWDGDAQLVEVLMRGPNSLHRLHAAVAAGRARGMPVGAGTILDRAVMNDAVAAGAAFAVSPGLDLDLVKHAASKDLPYLPGVATPSEIGIGLLHGCRFLKAFPANVLGPAWFREVVGPFPAARLVATGKVGMNAAELLNAGAVGVGVGGELAAVLALDLPPSPRLTSSAAPSQQW